MVASRRPSERDSKGGKVWNRRILLAAHPGEGLLSDHISGAQPSPGLGEGASGPLRGHCPRRGVRELRTPMAGVDTPEICALWCDDSAVLRLNVWRSAVARDGPKR